MSGISEPTPALPLDAYAGAARYGVHWLIWAVTGFMVAMVALAAIAPVHKVAVGEGKIIPDGTLVSVAHPEGGVVAEILARTGDSVTEGQVIMRLKPVAAESDLAQLSARRLGLSLTRERLAGLIEGRPADFAQFIGPNPDDTVKARLGEERALELEERAKAEAATGGLGARIAQREAELAAAERDLSGLKNQVRINQEQLAMREGLARDGYATRASVLEAQLALEEAEGRLSQTQGQIAATRSGLAQARAERAEALAERRRIWSAELTRATSELAEAEATLAKLSDRVGATEIRSPASGIIQEMVLKAAGELAPAGQPIAQIVPTNAPLFAEVRLRPEDLGEVSRGKPVKVTITAYDPEIYGVLQGVVRSISPTTFENDRGDRFYRAVVTLSGENLTRRGLAYPLLPGMGVRAEIITGDRSLLRHLLKPVDRALERAFQNG